MASQNNSKIEILRKKLSKMVLNDSRAMFRRKQLKNQQQFVERLIFNEKKNVCRRLLDGTVKNAPSPRPLSKRLHSQSVWKSEYDLLNMITHSLDRQLDEKHQTVWKGKQIGIQSSETCIQMIENFKQLDQQILIDSNGNRIKAKDVIQSNDILKENPLRIKYKLVPVIEGFSLVKNGIETEYKFCQENIDDNNNVLDDSETIDITMKPIETIPFERFGSFDSQSRTITMNTSPEFDYSDFISWLPDTASSTFILDDSSDRCSTPVKK